VTALITNPHSFFCIAAAKNFIREIGQFRLIVEACSRGVRRIWVASYDFQAPGFYEKAGFKRMAEFEGWPDGHINVIARGNETDFQRPCCSPSPSSSARAAVLCAAV
jgi:ribosomal protein S18 acetylase RimI-like enzyme